VAQADIYVGRQPTGRWPAARIAVMDDTTWQQRWAGPAATTHRAWNGDSQRRPGQALDVQVEGIVRLPTTPRRRRLVFRHGAVPCRSRERVGFRRTGVAAGRVWACSRRTSYEAQPPCRPPSVPPSVPPSKPAAEACNATMHTLRISSCVSMRCQRCGRTM